jgi:streptogramin lyase
MRCAPLMLLLTPLYLSCDATPPTQSRSDLAVRAQPTRGDDLSKTALVVGNFIPGSSANAILRYDAAGQFVDVLANLSLPNGPRGGCCLTFGPDEHLYVSAGGGAIAGHVNRFNGVTGKFIDRFVAPGSGGLMRPLVIVFGPDGNLYVGDFGSHSIRRYNGSTGAFIDHFVPPDNLGIGASDPQLFVFGPDGNLYVALPGSNVVRRFNGTTGALIGDFVVGTVERPVGPGLTFGRNGDLYVDSGNGVNRYDGLTGAFIGEFVTQGSGGLSVPVGLVFGPDGNLYVASATSVGDGSVLRYDGTTGAFLDAFVASTEPHITGPRVLEFKSKIRMCHRPPGTTGNEKTISIGYLSAIDHVQHGDAVGSCPSA